MVPLLIFLNHADISSVALFESLPVVEFVTRLLNQDIQDKTLSDTERTKVCLLLVQVSPSFSLALRITFSFLNNY